MLRHFVALFTFVQNGTPLPSRVEKILKTYLVTYVRGTLNLKFNALLILRYFDHWLQNTTLVVPLVYTMQDTKDTRLNVMQ